MPELSAADLAIIACHGDEAALDGWRGVLGTLHVPIAPDEVWVLGARADRAGILEDAIAKLPDALVLDQTDGWAGWLVAGAGAAEILSRLMLAPVPPVGPALVQGAISGVAGKVLVTEPGYCLLVPAPVGEFLRDRLLAVGADLGVTLSRAGQRRPIEVRA